jgi:hypothetical protein
MPPLMRSVTFESSRFETRTPAPEAVNPTCFGKDVAAWLRSRLPRSLEPGDPGAEDYGWGLWTRVGKDPYWIAIGLMDEGDTEAQHTWLITAAYDPGLDLLRRLFHRPRREDLELVCRAIDEALHGDSDITAVRWWDEQPLLGRARAHP